MNSLRGLDDQSARSSFLFWMTLCFGLFLAVYAPCEFRRAGETSSIGGLTLRGLASFGLAILSALVGLRWAVLFCMSFKTMRRSRHPLQDSEQKDLPFVSILVPAFNEAECVSDALSALICLNYPAYEIIFVDDGSSDDTYALALPFVGRHHSTFGSCSVSVFTRPNQGKWAAHNFALKHAKGDYVLCIDADSRIDAESLRLMVPYMADRRVGAVAGQIRVRNRNTPIALMQAFEYVLSNGALRMAQGATGSVMIVPGPIGLFRREALERVSAENLRTGLQNKPGAEGPFSHLTFAEDFHLSLTVLALGYRIEYEPHAIARTKAPATISALLNQRYRWNRGTMQVLTWFVRRIVSGEKAPFRLKAWLVTAFLLDYFVFPILGMLFLGSVVLYLLSGSSLGALAGWAFAAWMLNLMSGSLYAVAHRDSIWLCLLAPLFDLYQEMLLKGAWIIAVADQTRGTRMRW